MKKTYETPEVEIVLIPETDIIAKSIPLPPIPW